MAAVSEPTAFVYHLEEHGSKLLNNLHFQWKGEKYCDLIIHAQNRSLPMHACVMSAFSPKIASLISRQNFHSKVGTLNIYTVEVKFSYEVMESIVTALYTGVFRPPLKLLKDVRLAVQRLKITELIDAIKKHTDGLVEQKDRSFVAESSCNEHVYPTLTSVLGTSQAGLSSDDQELKVVIEPSDTPSSELDLNTPKLNHKSDSSQKLSFNPNSSVAKKISKSDNVNPKMLGENIRVDINTPCVVHSNNIPELTEVKTEVDEVNSSEEQAKDIDKPVTLRTAKSSRQRKRAKPQTSGTVLSKKRENDKGKTAKQKSSSEKVKKNKTSLKKKAKTLVEEQSDQQGCEQFIENNQVEVEGDGGKTFSQSS